MTEKETRRTNIRESEVCARYAKPSKFRDGQKVHCSKMDRRRYWPAFHLKIGLKLHDDASKETPGKGIRDFPFQKPISCELNL